jgi:hypothetical protein
MSVTIRKFGFCAADTAHKKIAIDASRNIGAV